MLEKINRDLSLRISLLAVLSMTTLLVLSLSVMLVKTKEAIMEDAEKRAENTLQGTSENIDNILLSVEETAGNMLFNMMYYLGRPERMYTYCQQLIEANPYVTGCVIAMQPGYYKQEPYFMVYMHRLETSDQPGSDSPIIRDNRLPTRPYFEQTWWRKAHNERHAIWLNPQEDSETGDEPFISYCMPIPDANMKTIGVVRMDVSMGLLSNIVAAAKPSTHSFCAVLDKDGSFIVHPNGSHLIPHTADKLQGESLKKVVDDMKSGKSSHNILNFNDNQYYAFYKPFMHAKAPYRVNENSGWSIGIAYSVDDIYSEYNSVFKMAVTLGFMGLVLMFVFALIILRHQLKPLSTLSNQAKRIALGHYDRQLPKNKRHDEVGRLHNGVERMQLALAKHIGELEQQINMLHERNKVLHKAYNQARKADLLKVAFLHNVTNQMIKPAQDIDNYVEQLRQMDGNTEGQTAATLADSIQENGYSITKTLNHILSLSEEDMRREVESHE
ncbi:HAMP domain-containing protein [Xylanibacter brevis]|uniref:HAMP domain-containing protein n=1 Tax=Xylanibacter brevis TaxID=83231 RepID=UPI000AAAFA9B|nr:cache domain-containing protein [Xylanibacter brevis]